MVSWHRSQLDEFDLWSDGSIDWTPSELATEERRYMASDSNDEPPGDSGPVTGSRWCCMTCRAASWIWDNEVGYVCQNCGGLEFFDVSQPTKMETSTGVWMYVPHSPSSAVGSPDEDSQRCQGSLSDSPGRSPKDVRNDQRLFGDPEQDEEGDDDTPALDPEALAEMAHVLTVTSKKLQASVLGRKFTGRRSIEERKKNSTCSAIGQVTLSAQFHRRSEMAVEKVPVVQVLHLATTSIPVTRESRKPMWLEFKKISSNMMNKII